MKLKIDKIIGKGVVLPHEADDKIGWKYTTLSLRNEDNLHVGIIQGLSTNGFIAPELAEPYANRIAVAVNEYDALQAENKALREALYIANEYLTVSGYFDNPSDEGKKIKDIIDKSLFPKNEAPKDN